MPPLARKHAASNGRTQTAEHLRAMGGQESSKRALSNCEPHRLPTFPPYTYLIRHEQYQDSCCAGILEVSKLTGIPLIHRATLGRVTAQPHIWEVSRGGTSEQFGIRKNNPRSELIAHAINRRARVTLNFTTLSTTVTPSSDESSIKQCT